MVESTSKPNTIRASSDDSVASRTSSTHSVQSATSSLRSALKKPFQGWTKEALWAKHDLDDVYNFPTVTNTSTPAILSFLPSAPAIPLQRPPKPTNEPRHLTRPLPNHLVPHPRHNNHIPHPHPLHISRTTNSIPLPQHRQTRDPPPNRLPHRLVIIKHPPIPHHPDHRRRMPLMLPQLPRFHRPSHHLPPFDPLLPVPRHNQLPTFQPRMHPLPRRDLVPTPT
ncbi:hypothetical protein GRF29_69g2015213 [Pseudopithomyces chartarum]|uniref:Uncharacterized protein n=1 Tax=Pseudopithomyces chartarum TaxID=1892770 RepID=A0AAN6M1T4_9PLEO|nr:hypothetical protein GRF29_69g2015213 [Pseudopithomyces chartarum]